MALLPDYMQTASYAEQLDRWPKAGRHVLAHYDETTIVVYQAYAADIAEHAVRLRQFGGRFSFDRMSWVKPNFLWMMYRSGWGTKPGQERTLAVRLRTEFFDEILASSVPSTFDASRFDDRAAWTAAGRAAEVRCQWDPDHAPDGSKCERRAVQLGLRGGTLRRYATMEPLDIADISEFVATQRANIGSRATLLTPVERVYRPVSDAVADHIGIDCAT